MVDEQNDLDAARKRLQELKLTPLPAQTSPQSAEVLDLDAGDETGTPEQAQPAPKPVAAMPKKPAAYRIKNGYVWIGQDGKASRQTEFTGDEPGFIGQIYKLEAIKDIPPARLQASREAERQRAEAEKAKRATQSPANRMAESPNNR